MITKHALVPRAATLALALAVLGTVGCARDESPASTESPTASHASSPTVAEDGSWVLGLDSRPTRAAINADVAFVSTAGSARFPPQLYLIDSTTGREVERRTATWQPYVLLVAPDGRLWVAGDRHPDQLGGAGINVHDPRSLVVVDHTDLPAQAFSLALVDGAIWVGSDGVVFVLDPATLDLLRTLPIGGPAYQLVGLSGGDGVIAVAGDRVERLQPDGAVIGSQALAADGNVVAATTASTVYVRIPVGADSTVLALDPALAAPGQPVGVDTDSTGGGLVAASSGDVILVDDRSDEVLCLPGGEPPVVRTPAPDLVGVLAELPDGRFVFATASGAAARAWPADVHARRACWLHAGPPEPDPTCEDRAR